MMRLKEESEIRHVEVVEPENQFQAFIEEICNEEALGSGPIQDDNEVGEHEGRDGHEGVENEDPDETEFERQCRDYNHPAPAVDTDVEWVGFNIKETEIPRMKYSNEHPPYLWLLQKLKTGDEFKEKLLRYVLKTNYG